VVGLGPPVVDGWMVDVVGGGGGWVGNGRVGEEEEVKVFFLIFLRDKNVFYFYFKYIEIYYNYFINSQSKHDTCHGLNRVRQPPLVFNGKG
jgi:hypothetical protein